MGKMGKIRPLISVLLINNESKFKVYLITNRLAKEK